MIDNQDLQDKLILRNRVFDYVDSIQTVVDFYCGQCVISNQLWSNIADNVICIDKKKQLEPINKNITRLVADNKTKFHLAENARVIDCDAYGLVMPFIKQIAKLPKTDRIIFFTDGTPTRQRKFKNAVREFEQHIDDISPTHIEYFENSTRTAFYGLVIL